MSGASLSTLVRFSVVVLLVGAAALLTAQFDLPSGQPSTALFFAAVAITTFLGGRLPGALSIILSIVAIEYLIGSPLYTLKTDISTSIQVGVFLSVSAVIVWLTANFRSRSRTVDEDVDVGNKVIDASPLPIGVEERLLEILANIPAPVAVSRRDDGRFVYVNTAFSELTGWRSKDLIDRTALECGLVDAATAQELGSRFETNGNLGSREFLINTSGGEVRTVMADGGLIEMSSGQNIVTTLVDVTERRRSDNELRASEERLHIVTEKACVGLAMFDRERSFTFVNRAFAELLPPTNGNVVGRSVAETHPDLYEKQMRRNLDRAFAGESVKYELRQTTPGGDRHYEVQYRPSQVNGSVVSVVAVVTDITERIWAELEREASEERYRTLFEYSPDGIVISNQQSYYVDANEALCEMLGYDRNEIVGLHASTIVVPKEIPHLNNTLGGLNADLEYYQEWQLRRRDGSIFPAEVTATVMPDGNTLTVVRDITERKHLEEQLLQAQKMEAIGVLAGGVAHDFNNILTAISGYSDLTLQNMSLDDPLRNYVLEIKESGIRAAALTGQLLAFSRKRVLTPSVHNLNLAVMDTERMLRRIVKENIEFRIDLDPALGNIKADPGQIAQVIVNLVVNSGDAMPEGGKLLIQTKNVYIGHDHSNDSLDLIPGPFVELTVADNGFGMDAETQRRLFEPFFTTKEVGKGTGLGLSTAFGIVKQSGGEIVVRSELGKGSTFKVYLPRVEEAVVAPMLEANNDEAAYGSETILLVEDEATVRTLINNVLTRSGFKVLVAGSGEAALEICGRYEEKIDMLLTDIIMPNMGGCELRDEIVKTRPDINLLLMSGYIGDSIDQGGFERSGTAFIEKPFTPDELVAKVRNVLAGKETSTELLNSLSQNTSANHAGHSR